MEEELKIETVETRRFTSDQFVATIEVEFCRNPRWSDLLATAQFVSADSIDGLALVRLAARIAMTGSALPPVSILQSPGEPVPLTGEDAFRLALAFANFGSIPMREDYSDGSEYLRLRGVVESILDVSHIHLSVRGSARREAQEGSIEIATAHLAEYAIATSSSPPLTFSSFVELLGKNRRIFSFSSGSNMLLGTSALAGAYQLAVLANPILTLQLAGAGAGAYIILKFGAAVGKKIEEVIQRW